MLTIDAVKSLLFDQSKILAKEEIRDLLSFFMKDSEGEAQFISEFVRFYFMAVNSVEGSTLDACHLCNQKYIANIQNKPELKAEHLPYLYVKEVEYYTIVNSYSECIRCINKIMELEDVPDFCMGAAYTQAVDIFIKCGLTSEAERYVEAMRVFSNLCDLPVRNLVMLDCNLMHAFAIMGKRREYESHRRSITRYSKKSLDQGIISLANLYVLGSEAIIDRDIRPSEEFVRQFCNLMETGSFSTTLTADYAEVVVPIIRWVKDKMPAEKLIKYMVHMIDCSDTVSDRIEMYNVLIEEFDLPRPAYNYIYEGYSKSLKEYYLNSRETHRHEVIGEMLSYELEKEYRKKALTDELTGIGNRAAFEKAVSELKPLCVGGVVPDNITFFAMDVNGLKFVNDTYGHQAGDDFIRGAANSLVKTIGQYGGVYRTGGDEFTALVRATELPVESLVKMLNAELSNWTDSYGNTLSISTGFARSLDYPGKAIDELMKLADEGMYADKSLYYKRTGKDRRKR